MKNRSTGEAQGLFEEVVAPSFEVQQQQGFHVGQAKTEIAGEVFAVKDQLGLELVEGREVLLEQGEAALHARSREREHAQADPERIQELQADALRFVQAAQNVGLEQGQAARGQGRFVRCRLGAAGAARGEGKDFGLHPEKGLGLLTDEGRHLAHLVGPFEKVDLVEDDHDALTPLPHHLQKGAFALRKRPVGRGHEQDEIRARHEVARERLVFAQDGVRAGGIDEDDLAEEVHGSLESVDSRAIRGPADHRTVAQHAHAGRGGGHPFFRHHLAEKRVDEGALCRS